MKWCKARARAQRWFEEVVTLWCEMDSFVEACEKDAVAWEERAARAQGELWFGKTPTTEESVRPALIAYNRDVTLAAGLRAYALKQAHIRRERGKRARARFEPFEKDVMLFLSTHSEDGWQWEVEDGPPVWAKTVRAYLTLSSADTDCTC